MTAPVPEERNDAEDLTETPPGEHDSELTQGGDGAQASGASQGENAQDENAQTSLDQPSQ